MKCYCIEFDLNKRSSKTVYVSKNSTFQIGIKCYKDGELLNAYELHDQSGTPLMPSSSKLADYAVWTLTSGDKEGSQQYQYFAVYTIKLPNGFTKNKKVELPPLTIVTTSSDVAEIQPKEDLSDYWKKSDTEEHQLSGTYEDGTEFSLTAICKKA